MSMLKTSSLLAHMIYVWQRCFRIFAYWIQEDNVLCLFANGVWSATPAWLPLLSYTGNQSIKRFDKRPSDHIAKQTFMCYQTFWMYWWHGSMNDRISYNWKVPSHLPKLWKHIPKRMVWCISKLSFKERLVGIAVDEAHCIQK